MVKTKQLSTQELKQAIQEQETKRDELITRLEELSQEAAAAMAMGQSTTDADNERHKVSEDLRHAEALIKHLNEQVIEIDRQVKLDEYVKYHKKQVDTITQVRKVKSELDDARTKFKKLETEYDELWRLRQGQSNVLTAKKQKLIEEWNFTESEIAIALK